MEVKVPTLLIDEEKCRKNIQKMADKAAKSNAVLRPHFKTHHSATIGQWFREYDIKQCTVSSVSMAHYFSQHGWEDITVAFPYNPLEYHEISELASRIKLHILLESSEALAHAKRHIKTPLGFFIKIDVGYHRTGIDHRDEKAIQALVDESTDTLSFRGFIAHAGHTYGAGTKEDIQWIGSQAEKMLTPLKERFGGTLSYGDTPSCSVIEDLSSYDEIRAGNFVFYDWMQHEIGSCSPDDIAVCMACPVVALHPERNEVVFYGGAVHLSKDSLTYQKGRSFGKVVGLHENGWDTKVLGNVDRISQEHGIAKISDNQIKDIKVGDIIGVIPVHSCLTADMHGHYIATSGERIEKISKT